MNKILHYMVEHHHTTLGWYWVKKTPGVLAVFENRQEAIDHIHAIRADGARGDYQVSLVVKHGTKYTPVETETATFIDYEKE